MIYAKAHDQTVAEDYFTAMQRVEERLEIVAAPKVEEEVVKVQEQVLAFAEQLEKPNVLFSERLNIADQLRSLLRVEIGFTR